MLDCSNNQLTEVPASLSQMSALEQLYLRHNKLDLLPNLKSPVLKVSTARFPAWFMVFMILLLYFIYISALIVC